MTDAREIIADAYRDLELNAISPDESAVAITRALYLAGFRILGPDDVEDVRRVVKIANRNEWSAEGDRLVRALGRKA